MIPAERLPPGFADQIEAAPNHIAEPKPAATVVQMRDATGGPEVLLLKRHHSSGFVPGAYVFAGGKVDRLDAAVSWTGPTEPPAEYWIAALREMFEETGVLLAHDVSGAALENWREQLLNDQVGLDDVLRALKREPAHDRIVYIAHWITPVVEPRRYDTRFFLAAMPPDQEVRADPREMTDALWLTPAAALARFEEGTLPMVFPTVKTLQQLAPFTTTAEALAAFREQQVKPILPRLVRRPGGVGLEIDE